MTWQKTRSSAGHPRNPEKGDSATRKHRMLWMISTSDLRSISSQNHARSAGSQDYRYLTHAVRFPRSSRSLRITNGLFMSRGVLQQRGLDCQHQTTTSRIVGENIGENKGSLLAVSTIDVLSTWRAGEIKRYANHVWADITQLRCCVGSAAG